jgi:hypothetical protein
MIELTIKLNDDDVRGAISKAWAREFAEPGYRDSGGSGWQEVVRQVKHHIEQMDMSEMIAIAARARIDSVINEVVTTALREKAKQRAKEMTKGGTLL